MDVPEVMVPYWDWANDKQIPSLLVVPPGVSRQPGTACRLADQPEIDGILTSHDNDYISFTMGLESVHENVHMFIGGDMSRLATAVRDPIFWLHHANIDRYWANWTFENLQSFPPLPSRWNIMTPYPDTSEFANDWTNYFYYYE